MTTQFAPQNSYIKGGLLSCGRDELPGASNVQLSLPNMLMIDRVVNINSTKREYGRGEIIAESDINPDLWFFGCRFEGNPVMPGCLDLDVVWQPVGFCLGRTDASGHGCALGYAEVKFNGRVLPRYKKITYHIHIKRVMNSKLVSGVAGAEMDVDGRKIYENNGLRVGLFTTTDDF